MKNYDADDASSAPVPESACAEICRDLEERFKQHGPGPVSLAEYQSRVSAAELKNWFKDNNKVHIFCVSVEQAIVFPASGEWRTGKLRELIDSKGGQIPVDIACKELGIDEGSLARIRKLCAKGRPFAMHEGCIRHADETHRKKLLRADKSIEKKKAIAKSVAALLTGNATGAPPALNRKLQRLWHRKPERMLALDGGTTNDAVARELSTLSRRGAGHFQLFVVTNSPDVADLVSQRKGDPTRHKVIQIGGTLRHESEAYVGSLTEFAFGAMKLCPDVSIIAATEMNSDGEFGSSDQHESQIKTQLLGRRLSHSLRVVDLDSSKILRMKAIAWMFTSMGEIDLVITDEAILRLPVALSHAGSEDVDFMDEEAIAEHFCTFWQLVADYQLPVLAGNTFHLGPIAG